MGIVVQKYGGSSVADADGVKRVAQGHAPRRQRDRVLVARDVIESEFSQTGWRIIGHIDFVPAYAMWRTYVLRKAA